MKLPKLSKRNLAVMIVLLFVLGQLGGTLAIRAIFINYKIRELSPRLSSIAQEIAAGEGNLSRNNDFIIKAFDVYGGEISIFSDMPHENLDLIGSGLAEGLKPHISKVISGTNFAKLMKLEGHPTSSIVIGEPISKQGKVMGVVFLLKPASDFQSVLNGFYVVFTLTLLTCVFILVFFLYRYVSEVALLEQMKRNYVANISHELKTPLASIRALTETLSDRIVKDDATIQRYYDIILDESSQLQHLIEDMLELSRLQSTVQTFHKEALDLAQILIETQQKYNLLLQTLGISVILMQIPKDLPLVFSNRARVMQILNILIDNATKAIAGPGTIKLEVEVFPKYLKCSVSDTGCGIESAHIPHVFDRFYHQKNGKGQGGSGLGLSIAKEIIDGLQEKIEVESQVNCGTTFSFTLGRK